MTRGRSEYRAHVPGHLGYVACLLLLSGMLQGCGDDDSVVARLIEHQGAVEKQGDQQGWQAVAGKDRFQCEHGLRTGDQAWARVEHVSGSRFRLKENTSIRFACQKKQAGYQVEFGESEIEAPPEGGELVIGEVVLTLGPGLQARLSAQDGRMRFDVMVGTAIVKRRGQPDQEVGPEQGLELVVGSVVMRSLGMGAKVMDAGADADAGATRDRDAGAATIVPVAVTARIKGRQNQLRAPGASDWQALPEGEHQLLAGTALRLSKGGGAALARGSERADLAGPAEITVGQPGDTLVEVHTGSALVQATDTQVRVRVPGGTIVARPAPGAGSQARVEVGKTATGITPRSGVIDVTGADGKTESLTLGERASLGRGGAIETEGRAPGYADLIITAGESASVHDPRPPTAVGVAFGALCTDGGVVEVASDQRFKGKVLMSKGTDQASVLLGPGTHFYRVRCLDQGMPESTVRQSGRMQVLRDDGTRKLAGRPPRNPVAADGRRYTLLYQNRLPEIEFYWRNPGAGGPYELHIVPRRGKKQVLTTDQPRYQMASGKLDEGTYTFFFQAKDGARSSTSTLRIDFDNAAPSAYLRAPGVNQAWTGATIAVAGAALPGWDVSIGDTTVSTDSQGRFSVKVPEPSRQRALAVKLSHRRGTHYYLRRDRSAN
jgi:hypothetical protein